jgi:hypothetical protein
MLDGALDHDEALATREHVANCDACSVQLTQEERVIATTRDLRLTAERDRRFWINAVAISIGLIIGAALGTVGGAVIGILLGYAAFRISFGRSP